MKPQRRMSSAAIELARSRAEERDQLHSSPLRQEAKAPCRRVFGLSSLSLQSRLLAARLRVQSCQENLLGEGAARFKSIDHFASRFQLPTVNR